MGEIVSLPDAAETLRQGCVCFATYQQLSRNRPATTPERGKSSWSND
jgi:hypothetical protein